MKYDNMVTSSDGTCGPFQLSPGRVQYQLEQMTKRCHFSFRDGAERPGVEAVCKKGKGFNRRHQEEPRLIETCARPLAQDTPELDHLIGQRRRPPIMPATTTLRGRQIGDPRGR